MAVNSCGGILESKINFQKQRKYTVIEIVWAWSGERRQKIYWTYLPVLKFAAQVERK